MQDVTALVDAAIARVLAGRPVPSTVSIAQAAEMLDVSTRTILRMNPPKAAGNKVPYSWVLKRLESK